MPPTRATASSRVALDTRMWRHSGIGTYLRGIATAMARLEAPPRLACLGSGALAHEAAALHPAWTEHPFDAKVYGLAEQLAPPAWGDDWALFHAPHYNFPLRWPASRPLVVTIHDLIHLDSPNPLKRLYMRTFLNRLQARDRSEGGLRVLAVSEATRMRLLERAPRLDAEHVRVVPHGLADAFRAGPPDSEALTQWRESRDLPADYALMVGIGLPHKNHAFALEALATMKLRGGLPWPVVLCGCGEEGAARFRRMAQENGIGAEFRAIPWLAPKELPSLFAAAAVLIHPSLVEGFGLPILEAQAMGTPVVAADRPAPREASGQSAFFFDPVDTDSLIATLERMRADANLRGVFVQRGLQRTRNRSWEESARLTVETYVELAGPDIRIGAGGAL